MQGTRGALFAPGVVEVGACPFCDVDQIILENCSVDVHYQLPYPKRSARIALIQQSILRISARYHAGVFLRLNILLFFTKSPYDVTSPKLK
jgi:hypothetical protein